MFLRILVYIASFFQLCSEKTLACVLINSKKKNLSFCTVVTGNNFGLFRHLTLSSVYITFHLSCLCIHKMPNLFNYVFVFFKSPKNTWGVSVHNNTGKHSREVLLNKPKRTFSRKHLYICNCCQDKETSHTIEQQQRCHWPTIPSSSYCSCSEWASKRPWNVDKESTVTEVSHEKKHQSVATQFLTFSLLNITQLWYLKEKLGNNWETAQI